MKHILITGGSRGIGRATALLAADRGWSVAINYAADQTAALDTARQVEARGARALTFKGDVTDETAVGAMFDAAHDRFGTLDGVVVNAGVVAPSMPLAEMSLDRLRRVFDINVLGSYLTAREAARRMALDRGGRGGAMVVVSSAAARLGSPDEYVDYAGAKAALDAMTIGLAKELGPRGIRVNAVRPGLIETGIHASGGQPDRAKRLGAATPLGRAGSAGEVAEAIVWLLSDAASYTNGAILDVTGGR